MPSLPRFSNRAGPTAADSLDRRRQSHHHRLFDRLPRPDFDSSRGYARFFFRTSIVLLTGVLYPAATSPDRAFARSSSCARPCPHNSRDVQPVRAAPHPDWELQSLTAMRDGLGG